MDFNKIAKTTENLEEVKKIKEEITSTGEIFKMMLGIDEETKDKIDKLIEEIPMDRIDNLSIEYVKELEKKIGIKLEVKLEGVNKYEYFRDFIIYSRKTSHYSEEIDKLNQELEKEMKESEKEMLELSKDTSLVDSIREELQRKIDNAPNDKVKEFAEKSMFYFNQGLELDIILDMVKTFSTKNILDDYRLRTERILTSYTRITKELKLKTNILKCVGLEKKLFDEETYEKYKDYNDLLIFIIMKYVVYHSSKQKTTIGLFILSFTMHLNMILENKFDEEVNEKFRKRVQEILDIVIG